MINPFLKRIMKDKKEDILHSSGYAKAQNGDRIGSASVESFLTRQKINANRNYVHGYRDSRVGQAISPANKLQKYDKKNDRPFNACGGEKVKK